MRGTTSRRAPFVPALLLALLAGACDSTDPVGVNPEDPSADPTAAGEAATLRLLLTDAPSDYIAEANVDIGRVELIPAGDGPPIVLAEDGTDGYVNLLDFQQAATMVLAEAEIEAGTYAQLRLIVEGAKVTLAEGFHFRDGSQEMDLKVPSGAQTGIKLVLKDGNGDPLEIVPGEMVLVLDFDVNRSFVAQGNPHTPAGLKSMLFKPTIKVTGLDVAASISGTVSTLLDGVSVAGRVVIAEPTDGGDLTDFGHQSEAGTGVTDENGDYTIFFLVPGEYEVSVMDLEPGLGTEPASRTVQLGLGMEATGADFEIIDVTGSISGTVSVAEGLEGVSAVGVNVTATPAAEGAEPIVVQTGEGGAYVFEDLLAGSYVVTIEVGADQLSDPAQADVELEGGQDVTGVDFVIVEDVSGSVAGTVSLGAGVEGVAVAGLEVTATAEGMDPVMVTTGEGGGYLFERLAPGTWTLTVAVPQGFVTNPASIEVEVADDGEVTGQDFVVEVAGT
ncbi:MAG: DUF4382 domain-containing protein [Longimicrobiales bacterium]|nr:DUF4382 domain-containing protein [Longimicrobiales bacterium]